MYVLFICSYICLLVLSVGAVEAQVVAVEVAVESRWSEFVRWGSAVADVRVCCGAYGPFCVIVVG